MTSTHFHPHPSTAPHRASRAVLQARGLRHAYADRLVLHGIDCDIPAGQAIALMGPSGSGKTTLLHALAGILQADAGSVTYLADRPVEVNRLGTEARAALRRKDFGLVFQSGQLLGELTAVENAALPLLLAGVAPRQAEAQAAAVLGSLGLGGLEQRRPGELSGGQQQRVAIARALTPRPAVIFADEPTGALDRRTGHEVMTVLRDAHRQIGAALVLVTHDPEMSARCDQVLHLRDGRIVGAELGAGR
ncbi:ABC transporter ATP-binding protein [Calidifontibacter sp. DB0510]|uniref:ABC transporter ATP-binding protein n=1 Tax=Metallococcus carri TaxID=1656884 RepID=A0A967EB95_9MICO|nr:ABC transporter ATP-binding protein [Metallococcus carri]NHN57075.1 ABC transporter ATP-binding protein [Metallococcus carri]NOP39056.1 ABC transporter ATP-binding protein [Calidifontibacter sp. DB2511S]